MATYLSIRIEKELDDIVFEEYGYTYHNALFEAEDDGKFETPINRALSFPARAIRYKKAKNIMGKYSKKILQKSESIIKRFEEELNKSIIQIKKRGAELQKQLETARSKGDESGEKAAINQQRKFKTEVENNQNLRVQNLNQSIDNLISAYTNGINKRIEEPGYVLKVELSDKGKADLKFFWEEHVAIIRQQIYEKLIKIINNKNVKGLETLIAKLEVEIDDAEDKRSMSKKYRGNIFRSEKKELEQEKREQMMGGKKKIEKSEPQSNSTAGTPNKQKSESTLSDEDFDKIIKYLDEELPDGILKENEPYRTSYKVDGISRKFDAYLEINKDKKEIQVSLYKVDQGPEDDELIKEFPIENIEDAENFSEVVGEGEEDRGYEDQDTKITKFYETLADQINLFFDTKKKRIVDALDFAFYNDYKHPQKNKDFCKYIVTEIIDNPKKYQSFFKKLQNDEVFSETQMLIIMRKFKDGFEKSLKEGFVSLKDYVKHHL